MTIDFYQQRNPPLTDTVLQVLINNQTVLTYRYYLCLCDIFSASNGFENSKFHCSMKSYKFTQFLKARRIISCLNPSTCSIQ